MNVQELQGRIDGFDYLRCLGLVLVLFQHQLSVLGCERYTFILGVNLGQLGVSVFLAVSGVLAWQSNREPDAWLIARLKTVYPAYWIATFFGFVTAAASGYKKITFYQFFSQFAGTGLFTHGMDLVNVATWFVSLLLALYLVVYVAKKLRLNDLFMFLLGSILLFVSAFVSEYNPMILVHAATFVFAAVCVRNKHDKLWCFLCLVSLAFLFTKSKIAVYPIISISLCHLSLRLPSAPMLVKVSAKYAYEFYLLHGIFLVGAGQVFKQLPMVSVPLGILSSICGAVFLHHSILYLRRFLPKFRIAGARIR